MHRSARLGGEAGGGGYHPLRRGLPAGLRPRGVRLARAVGARVRARLSRGPATAALRVCPRWVGRNRGLSGTLAFPQLSRGLCALVS